MRETQYPNSVIDLRSDTVTRPTPAMRDAMAEAIVGDDQYGEDPTVSRLERTAADMLGKEAAVYVPSGTMGNLTSLLAHCGRGQEAIVGSESHILWYESGGASTLGGIPLFTVPNDAGGGLDPDDVANAIRPHRSHFPRTALVCLENTHNRCGGAVLRLETMRAIVEVAHERDVPVHLDGARIFNAAAALGIAPSAIAAEVDSVQFCLSKGLSAPVGSVVVGTAEFIERVRDMRRLVGGAMRQSGVIAAAGLVALVQMVDRLPEDHARAKRLAMGLAEIDGVEINPERVQTNILVVKVAGVSSHEEVIDAFARNGLLVSNYGQRGIRFVTHHEIDDADIARALEIVTSVTKEMRATVGTAA